jgi:hypothetical protein
LIEVVFLAWWFAGMWTAKLGRGSGTSLATVWASKECVRERGSSGRRELGQGEGEGEGVSFYREGGAPRGRVEKRQP